MINSDKAIRFHKAAALYAVALTAVILTAGCKKSPEKIDLSSTHTTSAETMASSAAPTRDSEPETSSRETAEAASATQESSKVTNKKMTTKSNTYSSGKVSISYPSLVNMEDTQKSSAIDALLKKNALSVLDAWQIDDTEDSLNVSCKVLSADRNRITVLYTGTLAKKDDAAPVNIMYSNTIDVPNVSDIGFDHFADPYTMAGYVLSGDCTFYNVSSEKKAGLTDVKNDISLEDYTEMFSNADFPFEGVFPKVFSYEHQGVIYFSIPVPHELGDYAIVMFAPDNK